MKPTLHFFLHQAGGIHTRPPKDSADNPTSYYENRHSARRRHILRVVKKNLQQVGCWLRRLHFDSA